MAQSSRPQAGNVNTNPTYVDAGPYTADQWATLFRVLFTGDQQATQGVLKDVWNELEPTHPAGLNVSINTGVGICNGHVFFNDTSAVSITVSGGANRNDALCMVENNTNAALAPGAVYNTVGGANIPPYSCRLAVVKNEGANFTQTNNLYMVKLATFTTGAANITGFTDARTYCGFSSEITPAMIEDRTRRYFVPVMAGYNITDAASITVSGAGLGNIAPGVELPDSKRAAAMSWFNIRDDYSSDLSVSAVVFTGTGNIYVESHWLYAAACSEPYFTHSTSVGPMATAITSGNNNCIAAVTLATGSAGDIVLVRLIRNAANVLDTVGASAWVSGFLVSYTADS